MPRSAAPRALRIIFPFFSIVWLDAKGAVASPGRFYRARVAAYSIAPAGVVTGEGGFEATLVCRSVATAWAAPSPRAALNASPLAVRLGLDAACVAQLALHSCVMRVAFLAAYLASLDLKPM